MTDDQEVDQRIFDDGILHEINRQLLHPRGIALGISPATGQVFLYEAGDDEGWVYQPVNPDKAARFEERHPVLPDREELLGFIIQPLMDALRTTEQREATTDDN